MGISGGPGLTTQRTKGKYHKIQQMVEEQVSILQSQGKEADDLLTNLWKTYQKALNTKFVVIFMASTMTKSLAKVISLHKSS